MRIILLALVFALASCSLTFAQDKQPPANPPSTAPPSAAQVQANKNRAAFIKRLVGGMDQLIPGELKPDSPLSKQLAQVAEVFANGKIKDCKEFLDGIVAKDKTFPPTNLMLASLFFASNNASIGRQFLEKAASENPEYPATYAGFARIAVNQNRVTDADALILLMKSKIDAGKWNGVQSKQFRVEFLDVKTDIAMRRKKYDLADEYLRELTLLLPKDGRVPLRHARVCFQQEKIDSGPGTSAQSSPGKGKRGLAAASNYRQLVSSTQRSS